MFYSGCRGMGTGAFCKYAQETVDQICVYRTRKCWYFLGLNCMILKRIIIGKCSECLVSLVLRKYQLSMRYVGISSRRFIKPIIESVIPDWSKGYFGIFGHGYVILNYFQRSGLRNFYIKQFVGNVVGREWEPSGNMREKLSIRYASRRQGTADISLNFFA